MPLSLLTWERFYVNQECIRNNEEDECEEAANADGDRQTTLLLRLLDMCIVADLLKWSCFLQWANNTHFTLVTEQHEQVTEKEDRDNTS